VLQQPAVGAVIVGTRLGVSDHVSDNTAVFGFCLEEEEMAVLDAAALGVGQEKLRKVFEMLGDCGNEYKAMH
jgi:diketogulonate reductase-like aldo/keto reductase